MQNPQRKPARPTPLEEPAAKKGFAGRPALISGLMEGQAQDPLDAPLAFFPDQKDSRQIISSRRIYEAVLMVVESRNNTERHREALVSHATAIYERRKATEAERRGQPAVMATGARTPTTPRGVLEAALAEAGLNAQIVSEKERGSGSIFTVECNGETNMLPVSETVMKGKDPVALMVKMLSVISLGVSAEEKRVQALAQRRSTRPPPTPLGIDSRELDGRLVTFDGKSEMGNGDWTFTYLAEGIGTSFFIASSYTGRELLEKLDDKLDSIHAKYGQPFPAEALEYRASREGGKAYMEGIPAGVLPIARALDYLVCDCVGSDILAPPEYREAHQAMKAMPRPGAAFLSGEEMAELRQALHDLDHPIYTILQETYGGNGTRLHAAAQAEAASLL